MALVTTALDELTYRVNGLAMQVQSELRPGHREKVYQARLAELLIQNGFQVEAEKRVEVYINDALAGYMYLDLWVEQVLVVECKAFSHQMTNDEIGQVITYLAATGSPVGLLYNFGRQKLEWKRVLPPRRVQEWHTHLYRCVWTPPGVSLPPIESITGPIHFSAVSPARITAPITSLPTPSANTPSVTDPSTTHSPIAPSSVPVSPSTATPSASPPSLQNPSLDDPPVPIPRSVSVSPSADDPSAPIRLSASAKQSADDPSAPIRLSASAKQSADDPSAPIRLSVSAKQSVDDPSAPIRLSASAKQSADDPSAPIRLSVSAKQSADDAYASAGVNIDAGNRAVELMRDAVRSTYGPEVLAGIGAFGGLFDAGALQRMQAPVLVASTDGVGTKVKLAAQAGRYESIGHDLVNHCLNDILVQGARPLFFLDYIASSRLEPEMVASVVAGLAAACRAAGCALIGGETAEMPGVYQAGEFDVAGTIVGVVERARLLPRPDLQPGDVLIGLRASGPHTNGYSLIRHIIAGLPLEVVLSELGTTLADALLAPHRSYLPIVHPLLSQETRSPIKALAHLTGGGFIENIPRVLPPGVGAQVRLGSWPVLPIFQFLQQRGGIETTEMHRVFNMGIGMVLVCARDEAPAIQAALPEESFVIGELVAGEQKVILR